MAGKEKTEAQLRDEIESIREQVSTRIDLEPDCAAESRRARERLLEQEDFLEQIIESLTQPLYVVDAKDYTVKLANSAARSAECSSPVTCYALTHGSAEACHGPDHHCPLHLIKETRKPVTVEHVHADDGGAVRHIEVHGYPVFSPRGEVSHIIEYSFDITERKEMEKALRVAKEELEARVRERTSELEEANRTLQDHARRLELVNRELQEFAFMASHHLQEPLRKIQMFADILRPQCLEKLGEEGCDRVARIERSARWMRDLLQDLLSYSRLVTHGGPFTRVDLGRVVRGVADRHRERLEQEGGRVEISALPIIDADEEQMRLLFENLIENALKYRGAEKPLISVYADESADGNRICIEDNGIGFDQEYLENVFRPLQQLHGKEEYDGTGMGLAVCRKIVERHGGTITARSTPGKGSTFMITLP
jgi:signal transduction histidine kinase